MAGYPRLSYLTVLVSRLILSYLISFRFLPFGLVLSGRDNLLRIVRIWVSVSDFGLRVSSDYACFVVGSIVGQFVALPAHLLPLLLSYVLSRFVRSLLLVVGSGFVSLSVLAILLVFLRPFRAGAHSQSPLNSQHSFLGAFLTCPSPSSNLFVKTS